MKKIIHLLITTIVAACGVPSDDVEQRGFSLPSYANGLAFSPAFALGNGESLADGVVATHGVRTTSGLATATGLFSTGNSAGVLDSPEGRVFVKALVECALPPGQSVSKTVAGTNYVFAGKIGVAPTWRFGSCNATCQQWVTACVLAQSNASGAVDPIELRANNSAINYWAKDVAAIDQERAWFGNMFSNPPLLYQSAGSDLASVGIDVAVRDCDGGTPCAISTVGYMILRCTPIGSAESASACTASAGGPSFLPVTTHLRN
jgi:hypothetical protein